MKSIVPDCNRDPLEHTLTNALINPLGRPFDPRYGGNDVGSGR